MDAYVHICLGEILNRTCSRITHHTCRKLSCRKRVWTGLWAGIFSTMLLHIMWTDQGPCKFSDALGGTVNQSVFQWLVAHVAYSSTVNFRRPSCETLSKIVYPLLVKYLQIACFLWICQRVNPVLWGQPENVQYSVAELMNFIENQMIVAKYTSCFSN